MNDHSNDDEKSISRANRWDREWGEKKDDLYDRIAPLNGYPVAAEISKWEMELRGTKFESFAIDHARYLRQPLMKNPGGNNIQVNAPKGSVQVNTGNASDNSCLLYTSPSPRD